MDTIAISLALLAGQPQILSLVMPLVGAANLTAGVGSETYRLLTLLWAALRRNG